jgi:glycosyltransferase involved in cell wall biosynthesis
MTIRIAMANIKAAFVLQYDALDIRMNSGTPFYMTKGLQAAGFDLQFVSPLPGFRENLAARLAAIPAAARIFMHRKLMGKFYEGARDPAMIRILNGQIERRLSQLDVEVVISSASVPFARLRTKKPTVFWTDAVYSTWAGFYDPISTFSKLSIQHGNTLEKLSLEHASAAVYASQWAANSAIRDYNADSRKVHVVPFGANLSQVPTASQVDGYINGRSQDHCQLLFLGVDWIRKGGPLVLATARELNRLGLNTTLHVVGLRERPKELELDFVRFHGFVSKNSPEGLAQLQSLLSQSHFLIVPSIAECFGIVFCEASAFGLPSISRNVGGISSAVREDKNGKLFAPHETADVYARYIQEHFSNWNGYLQLAHSSRHEFDNHLSWPAASGKLRDIVQALI